MAVPKKRRSKSKQRIKQAYFKIDQPNYILCKNCGGPVHPHRACTTCGVYKGRQVITIKEKTPESKES